MAGFLSEPKGKKKKTSSAQPGKKPRKKADKGRPGAKLYETLAINYLVYKNQSIACSKSNFSPSSATFLFGLPKIRELLDDPKIQQAAAEIRIKLAKESVEKTYVATREFLDPHAMHLIENGPTHFIRGDRDKVEMIKVLYEVLGDIKPRQTHIVNNAQSVAGAQVKSGTMYEIYKAQWLIDKENELRQRCEAEYAAQQQQLPAATEPSK